MDDLLWIPIGLFRVWEDVEHRKAAGSRLRGVVIFNLGNNRTKHIPRIDAGRLQSK
jgi:hypothetical protein